VPRLMFADGLLRFVERRRDQRARVITATRTLERIRHEVDGYLQIACPGESLMQHHGMFDVARPQRVVIRVVSLTVLRKRQPGRKSSRLQVGM
jgi:hypothetical protein